MQGVCACVASVGTQYWNYYYYGVGSPVNSSIASAGACANTAATSIKYSNTYHQNMLLLQVGGPPPRNRNTNGRTTTPPPVSPQLHGWQRIGTHSRRSSRSSSSSSLRVGGRGVELQVCPLHPSLSSLSSSSSSSSRCRSSSSNSNDSNSGSVREDPHVIIILRFVMFGITTVVMTAVLGIIAIFVAPLVAPLVAPRVPQLTATVITTTTTNRVVRLRGGVWLRREGSSSGATRNANKIDLWLVHCGGVVVSVPRGQSLSVLQVALLLLETVVEVALRQQQGLLLMLYKVAEPSKMYLGNDLQCKTGGVGQPPNLWNSGSWCRGQCWTWWMVPPFVGPCVGRTNQTKYRGGRGGGQETHQKAPSRHLQTPWCFTLNHTCNRVWCCFKHGSRNTARS